MNENGFLTIASIVIPVIIALAIYFWQKQKKEIKYIIVSNISLLTNKEAIEDKIKIYFNDIEVKDITILEIELINTGNTSFTIDDYESPIGFGFEKSKVLSAEIVRLFPTNLNALIEVTEKGFYFKPFLFNVKESITTKIILSGFKNNLGITVQGRIRGISEISRIKTAFETPYPYIAFIMLILFLLTLGVYDFFKIDIKNVSKNSFYLAIVITQIFVMFVASYLILNTEKYYSLSRNRLIDLNKKRKIN